MKDPKLITAINPAVVPSGDFDVTYGLLDEFPGYAIGSDGSVWSMWKSGVGGLGSVWRQRVPQRDTDRYGRVRMFVQLRHKDGSIVGRKIHRLVLEAFIGQCPDGMEACHFPDSDQTNNRLSNLRWGTKLENESHKTIHNTAPCGERNPRSKLSESDVLEIRKMKDSGISYSDISRMFKISRSNIHFIVSRQTWSHV